MEQNQQIKNENNQKESIEVIEPEPLKTIVEEEDDQESIEDESEIEQENLIKPIYTPENKTYKYIDHDQLSKTLNFTDITTSKNVIFCAYSINTECYIEGRLSNQEDIELLDDIEKKYNEKYPFLQFITYKNKDIYDFPSREHNFITSFINSNEEEKSQEQIHFETENFNYLLSLFQESFVLHTEKINFKNIYNGFIEKDNNLFVFYDVSFFIKNLKPEYTVSIIDELLYKKKIYSTQVNPVISTFFKDNKNISRLQSLDDYIYPFPFQLYMCNFTDEYENIRKDDVIDSDYQTIDHPFLRTAYYFTSYPIFDNEQTEQLQRYVCFIINGLYLMKDISTEMTDDEKPEYEDKILAASTIYFHENDLQLWGVKNIGHFTKI
jgi:hypothetical protein